ncbi:complement factor B-like protease [Agelaius tricolor]|uniref:complement factor B-like protease n=1 Tax=Agelaius tricolor TaxID=9191 RepID=UPI0039F1E174
MAGAVLALLLLLPPPTLGTPSAPPLPPRCDPSLAPISGGRAELAGGRGGAALPLPPPAPPPPPPPCAAAAPTGAGSPCPGGEGRDPPRCQAVWCPGPLEFDHGWFYPAGGAAPPGLGAALRLRGGVRPPGPPRAPLRERGALGGARPRLRRWM